MKPLTRQLHDQLRGVLKPGDIAIDATAGNGHDTRFLAEQVGPTGTVYAFDIQQSAIEATSARLAESSLTNVKLFHLDHACMVEMIAPEHCGRVSAVMFNLGYLPGGNKTLVTRPKSTVEAISASLQLLKSGGMLTIVVYRGHEGGREEYAAIMSLLAALPANEATFESLHPQTDDDAPQAFLLTRLT